MAKPVLKRRGQVGKSAAPTGLPEPKSKQELTPELLARNAVDDFEKERTLLADMLEDFEQQHSEAASALQTIKQQEDIVASRIADAKSLVAAAKKTIGEFICQIKHSKPKYDDAAFTELVGKNEDPDTVIELVKAGAVKKIVLGPSAVKWFAQHPDAAENYVDAWRDKAEMTPAITVPKL